MIKIPSSVGSILLRGFCIAVIAAFTVLPGLTQQKSASAPGAFITGVVQGPKGPEAGVWVIAETKDLLTNFIKIGRISRHVVV